MVLKTASGTTQIDHVVVSKFGVFAIETKNYRGEIYGNDDREEWTQIIVTDVTYMSNVYAAKQNYNSKIASGICPRCGGNLVRRNGKYGSFYGCSNYPGNIPSE